MGNGKRKKADSGKPRKAPDELKDNLIKVRVTDDQKRLFADTAEAEGLDVSSWLRQVGIRAAKVVSDREGGDK
jgi:uncharacterized protein (DUF1778 family)